VGLPADGRAWRVAATLLLAAAAGAIAQALHGPLPWMIGPLLVTAIGSAAGLPLAASLRLRNIGQWLIGTTLGLYFTPAVVQVVVNLGPAIVLGVVWALLLGHGFYRFLMRTEPGGTLQPASAYFAAAIGGASEMALMAERNHAQVDRVASAHSLRVLIVVVLIPFAYQALGVHGADLAAKTTSTVQPLGLAALLAATAAGGALLWRLKVPNPWVLGALAVSMVLTGSGVAWSAMPKPAASAGQLAIAVMLGVRFTPASLRAAPRWLGAVAVGTLGMIVLSAGFAALLAWGWGLHPATALLATSPGGMSEMSITASVLGLGVPVVTAFHVVRYAAVLVLTGPLWRLEAARLKARAPAGAA
jgi:hypothetical protein